MTIEVKMRGDAVCRAVDRYCREHYGPRSNEYGKEWAIRQKMAKEFSAIYEVNYDILCDVLLFYNEADYLIFKLKVL